MRNNTLSSWFLLIALALLWGGAFLLIKLSLDGFSPLQVALLRIGFGAITLSPVAYFHFKSIDKKMLPWVIFAGFLGSLLPAFLFSMAEEELSSGIAGVLSSLTPLFTIIIGVVFFKQRTSNSEISGLFLAFSGAILLILSGKQGNSEFSILHALMVVLACVCYASNINIIKYKLSHVPAMEIASGSLVGVGIVSWIAIFFTDFTTSVMTEQGQQAIVYVVFLGATATGIALILFNRLLKVATPLFASSVTYLIPVIAVLLGIFFRGEVFNWMNLISLIMILLGIYLINKRT